MTNIISYMATIVFISTVCLIPAKTAAENSSAEQALVLYQQAEVQFTQGQLEASLQLANRAVELHSTDGIVLTNHRHSFTVNKIGRKQSIEKITVADENTYLPNDLLARITQQKKALAALTKNKHKQQYPPQLIIAAVDLWDEDNNGTWSALEKGGISLTISNIGGSTAEQLQLNIEAKKTNISGLTQSFSLQNIAPNQTKTVAAEFQLPKNVYQHLDTLRISVKEKDSMGELSSDIPFPTRIYFAPILQAQIKHEQSNPLIAGRPASIVVALSNKGLATARDIQMNLDYAYADTFKLINDLDVTFIKQLAPGQTRQLRFTLKPNKDTPLGADMGLSLVHRFRGHESRNIVLPLMLASSQNYSLTVSEQEESKQDVSKTALSQNHSEPSTIRASSRKLTGAIGEISKVINHHSTITSLGNSQTSLLAEIDIPIQMKVLRAYRNQGDTQPSENANTYALVLQTNSADLTNQPQNTLLINEAFNTAFNASAGSDKNTAQTRPHLSLSKQELVSVIEDTSNMLATAPTRKSKPVSTLHVYLHTSGSFDLATKQAFIEFIDPITKAQERLSLNQLVNTLQLLPVDDIVLYIESSFALPSGFARSLVPAYDLIETPHRQSLANIHIVTATIPLQQNASIVKTGTGVFTYALFEQLVSQVNAANAMGSDHPLLNQPLNKVAISKRVAQITCTLNQQCQQIQTQLLPRAH